MIRNLLFVGIGGAVGSIMRYLISVYINRNPNTLFPWATFTANMIGCLLIGTFFQLFEKYIFQQPELRLLLITGFCGGLTTFSTFSAEGISLMQAGHYTTAVLYIACSIVAGLGMLLLGMYAVRLFTA